MESVMIVCECECVIDVPTDGHFLVCNFLRSEVHIRYVDPILYKDIFI